MRDYVKIHGECTPGDGPGSRSGARASTLRSSNRSEAASARRLAVVLVALALALPLPIVQAGHDGPGTHFGNGNLPAGCTTDSTTVVEMGSSMPKFMDDCYHMRTGLNSLDTPVIDVLIVPPASPYPERDLRVMRQAIEMWDAGIDHLARDMGLDWLADGVEFNIFLDDDEFTTHPAWDPEIIVVASNPVGGAGIGIDPFGLNGPCRGANPLASMDVWESLPGFDSHHDGHSGTYVETCEGGGTTCYAVNGAIDPLPGFINFFGMFDLVAHEVGHCLSIGHVGDAGDHKANNVPYPDIMSYTPQSHTKCVSTLDVESLALRMSRFLLPAPLVANHADGPRDPFQVQHPDDHYYASTTGDPRDCPQPDQGIIPGDKVSFEVEREDTGSPALVIDGPQDGEVVSGPVTVSGTVDRAAGAPLSAELHGPETASTDEATRYLLAARGGQSADGHTCDISAEGAASTVVVAGTAGCTVDVTWAEPGSYAVTGQVHDGRSTATDGLQVRVVDPEGIPDPTGEISGGITIFPTGVSLAYNELGAFATSEAGDPAPKFLPGTAVELNTRFTVDAAGVAGPATAGETGPLGLPFTWHVWSSDGTPVDRVGCTTVQDRDTTGAPNGFNCRAGYTMPEELGRYYTTLRFDTDQRWSCHNGGSIFSIVPSDVPNCLKAFDVVARDDAAPDGPAATAMAPGSEVLGPGVVPFVIGHVGDVTVSDADGTLRVAMAMEGFLDATVPGPLGNPFVYQVTFTTDHNGIVQEYALQYTYETDPFGALFPEDKFRLLIHTDANAAGVRSICPVAADLSQSFFDLDTFEAVWVVSLAEFDHDTRTAQGNCGMSAVREGRGLQAGDVLTNIRGTATGKVGVIQFGDLQDTTEVPDYTVQSGSAAGPVVTALDPPAGSSEGGTLVTVSGTGFQSGATVTFGSTPATGVQFVAPDQLTATTPAHAAGAVDVTVTNPDGQASTLTGGFTYQDPGSQVEHVLLAVGDRSVRVDVNTSATPRDTFQGDLDLTGLSGNQTITADWYDADGTLLASDSVTVRMAAPFYDVQVTAPADADQARGTTRTYTFTVANTGDTEDTYDLVVADDKGWASLDGSASVTVAAGENASVAVQVSVPQGGQPDSSHVRLTAGSRADGGVFDGAGFTVSQAPPGPPNDESVGVLGQRD